MFLYPRGKQFAYQKNFETFVWLRQHSVKGIRVAAGRFWWKQCHRLFLLSSCDTSQGFLRFRYVHKNYNCVSFCSWILMKMVDYAEWYGNLYTFVFLQSCVNSDCVGCDNCFWLGIIWLSGPRLEMENTYKVFISWEGVNQRKRFHVIELEITRGWRCFKVFEIKYGSTSCTCIFLQLVRSNKIVIPASIFEAFVKEQFNVPSIKCLHCSYTINRKLLVAI